MAVRRERDGEAIDRDVLLAKALAHGADLGLKNAEPGRQNAELGGKTAELTAQNARLAEKNQRLEDLLERLVSQNDQLMVRLEELTSKVAELTEERDKNSRNSNKPPSSDSLKDRRSIRKKKRPTGRKRGGQKGHQGHHRALVPADEVDVVIDIFPSLCEICLQVPPRRISAAPSRFQVVDLLEHGGRQITEYRQHTVDCDCGARVAPSRDEVPRSAFGPRLKSTIGQITGGYNLSRRQVPAFLNDVFGIKMSLGSVSNIEREVSEALAPASDEARAYVERVAVKHIDETSWVRNFEVCSLWVIASTAVSVFRIVKDGRRSTLRKVLRQRRGILVSDRASVFLFWSMRKRQVCWSHLQRAFVGFSQRDGPAGALGRDLVTCAELLFGYWRQVCSGELSRERFEQWMESLRETTKQLLERGAAADYEYSGSCANMLKHWDAMWTFVETPGVEPTNNHAERELRRLVMWRRRCFGTQSDRGDRFVERIMTVTHTLHKQGRRVLAFLQESLMAMQSGEPAPLLIPS